MAIDLEQLNIVITGEAMDAIATLDILTDRLKELKAAASGFSAKAMSSALKGIGKSARQATTDSNNLSNSLEGVTTKTGGVVAETEAMGDSLDRLDSPLRDVWNGVKDFKNNLAKSIPTINLANTRLGRLANTIKRVAVMRLIRWSIRQLVTAAKEGLQILIEWDRTFGNNTSYAAKTVDELSAKWREVKKAVGAALMPLIQILQPVLNWAMNAVVSIANVLNQILRSVQGFSTYMKSTYIETKNTVGAAKELRRVLFGFDELNVLPSDNGGSSGLDVSAIDFIPTEIADNWRVIGEQIKKVWGELTVYIKDNFKGTLEGVKQMAGGFGKMIKGILFSDAETFFEGVKDLVGGLDKFIMGVLTGLWNFFVDGLTLISKGIWTYIKEPILNIYYWITDGAAKLLHWFEKNILLKAAQKVDDFIQWLPDGVKEWFGIDGSKLHEYVINLKIKTDTWISPDTQRIIDLIANVGKNTIATGISTMLSAQGYATGGSPDMGTLFWAGEQGAEIVANTPSGTGVMNMKQMQDAVSNGNVQVVNALGAMTNAVVSAINSKDTNAYLDGQKITETVLRRANGMARATGQPVLVR